MNAMALVGIPPATPHSQEFTVIHGLRAAVEALAEPTEQQKANLAAKGKVLNRARVICITSARDNSSMNSLQEIFHTVVTQQNRISGPSAQGFLKIDQCHLVVINLHPSGLESLVSNQSLHELNAVVRSEVHTVKASDFAGKLTHLILPHYDLASTTVIGDLNFFLKIMNGVASFFCFGGVVLTKCSFHSHRYSNERGAKCSILS